MTEDTGDGRGGTTGPLGGASRRDFLQATAGVGALATGLGGVVGTAAAGGIDTPWLSVDGNLVKDPLGNDVILRGVNVGDPKRMNTTASARGKNAEQIIHAATSGETGWHANFVRLPVHPWDVADLPPVPLAAEMDDPPAEFVPVEDGNGYYQPPIFTRDELETYVETHLRPAVEACRQRDVYCIVDYHRHWGKGELAWAELDEYTNPIGPYEPLDEEVRLFWDTMAPHFAEDPHVVFELYNEPTKPGWGNEETIWTGWKEVAQPWVDLIREHAPRNLILIGSPRWARMPWGVNIELFDGDNLGYTYHAYPGHGITDFDDDTQNAWETAPLFATEWGYEQTRRANRWISGTTERFGRPFKEWARDRPVHWTAWCFDPIWLPAMMGRAFETDESADAIGDPYSGTIPTHCEDLPCEWETLDDGGNYAGQFVKDWLAETRDADVPQVDYDPEPPERPQSLAVDETTRTSLTLSWDPVHDPGDSPFDYHVVYLDGERHGEVPGDATETTVSDLLADVTYEVGVSGVDVAGNEGPVATVTATTDAYDDGTAPPVPDELTVDEVTHLTADVSWSAVEDEGTSGLHHYEVFVDGDLDQTVPDGTTATTIADLQPDTTYEVTVRAVDTMQNASAASESATAWTQVDRPDDDALVIHDFTDADPWPDGNLLDEQKWVGSSSVDATVEDERLHFDYDSSGWFGTTVDTDVSAYSYAKVRVAGAEGGEESDVTVRIGEVEAPLTDLSDQSIETRTSLLAIDLEEAGVADVPAEFRFFFSGTGQIEVDAIWFDDEPLGSPSDPTETPTETPTDGPVPVGGGDTPRDPDEDGLYEDVNGDGATNLADAGDLFQHRNSAAVQENADAYDFSGNDEIDLADVVQLFQENAR